MSDICSVDGCESAVDRKPQGWCEKHYSRWRRYGSVHVNHRIIGDDEARFWSKVDKSGDCWVWTGSVDRFGYGEFRLRDVNKKAHSYSLAKSAAGPRPDGMFALHKCDNPPCVNPEHLYWGTRQQNADDMVTRDRVSHGERKHNARLTERQVVSIRHEYANGAYIGDLSRSYGVAAPTIRGIVLGIKWKRAGGPITRRRNTINKEKSIG